MKINWRDFGFGLILFLIIWNVASYFIPAQNLFQNLEDSEIGFNIVESIYNAGIILAFIISINFYLIRNPNCSYFDTSVVSVLFPSVAKIISAFVVVLIGAAYKGPMACIFVFGILMIIYLPMAGLGILCKFILSKIMKTK